MLQQCDSALRQTFTVERAVSTISHPMSRLPFAILTAYRPMHEHCSSVFECLFQSTCYCYDCKSINSPAAAAAFPTGPLIDYHDAESAEEVETAASDPCRVSFSKSGLISTTPPTLGQSCADIFAQKGGQSASQIGKVSGCHLPRHQRTPPTLLSCR